MSDVGWIDEEQIRTLPGEIVRGGVKETLNAWLAAGADRLYNAAHYEPTQARRGTRAASYKRSLRHRLQSRAGTEAARVAHAEGAQCQRGPGDGVAKAGEVVDELRIQKLRKAVEPVNEAVETLSYDGFLEEHWRRITTNNPFERIIREIRRRTRVVAAFSDGESALTPVVARVGHIAGTPLVQARYLNMQPLHQQKPSVVTGMTLRASMHKNANHPEHYRRLSAYAKRGYNSRRDVMNVPR